MCRIKSLPSFLLPSSCNQNPKDHTFLHPTIHLIYIFFSSISSWFLLFPFFFSFFPFLSCSLHFSIPSINHSLYFSSYFVFFSCSLRFNIPSIHPSFYFSSYLLLFLLLLLFCFSFFLSYFPFFSFSYPFLSYPRTYHLPSLTITTATIDHVMSTLLSITMDTFLLRHPSSCDFKNMG